MENPYWQFLCGETYLQAELPVDPASLTRWRKRIEEEGVETLLTASIDFARRGGVIKQVSTQKVVAGTTVVPKAIAYPTDSLLLETSRQHHAHRTRQCHQGQQDHHSAPTDRM